MSALLGRRRLLQLGGLALAARAVPTWAAARWDPPPLPVRRPAPGVVEAELTAMVASVVVAGRWATLSTYNGCFPGPVLRVREGELVRIAFTNRLDEPTNLHFHGLHISPRVDNPFLHVAPGQRVEYEWTVPEGAAGTHWYHPHLHGMVARQVFAGLAGAIVVESPIERELGLHRAEEHLLVLKDLSLAGTEPAPHSPFDWMQGKEGDLLLVNGTLNPILVARRALLRLRLLNASNARYYRLRLEGHWLHLVATDGGFVETPEARDELLLAPGERAEVLVRLLGPGVFRLRALPYDRGSAMMGHGGHRPGRAAGPVTLATFVAPTWLPGGRIPDQLVAVEQLGVPAEPTRRLVLSERMMGRFLINGRAFDENRVDIRGRLGDVELWEIENRGGMDHPIHLHTYPFQIVSRNGVPEALRAWKDTVNVRPGERVRLAVALRDVDGRTVFHCHILEHEDLGMMGVLAV